MANQVKMIIVNFFHKLVALGKQSVNFKRIIDGRDKLIAWTNDAGKSDLFTCKKTM